MNNRYIIDILKEMKHNCLNKNNYDDPKRNDKAEALNYAIFCVERQEPTVDAEPVRHGRWDNIPNTYMTVASKFGSYSGYATSCSVCHEVNPNAYKTNYCPNCGAKMDGGGNGCGQAY